MPKDTINSAMPFAVNHSGGWVHSMTPLGSTRIYVELMARLYWINDDGSLAARGIELEIEYRLAGSCDWLQVAVVRMTGAATTTTYRNIWMPVPKGQYEVRVRKVTGDIKTSRESNEVWAILRDAQINEQTVIDVIPDDLRRNGTFARQPKGTLA